MDNSGENNMLEKELIKSTLKLNVEYTSPSSPQYNGIVERGIASLHSKARSMLHKSRFNKTYQLRFWAECIKLVTYIDNRIVTAGNKICSYQSFYNLQPNKPPMWCPFGCPGIMKLQDKNS